VPWWALGTKWSRGSYPKLLGSIYSQQAVPSYYQPLMCRSGWRDPKPARVATQQAQRKPAQPRGALLDWGNLCAVTAFYAGRPIRSPAERLRRFPILGVVMTAKPADFVTRASSRVKSHGFSQVLDRFDRDDPVEELSSKQRLLLKSATTAFDSGKVARVLCLSRAGSWRRLGRADCLLRAESIRS
jgi:hypothetical protein